MGLLVYSGSGQAVALNLVAGGESSLITFALTLLVMNCRYLLISIATAQRLDNKMSAWQKTLFGLFNTDEVFAVAIRKEGKLQFPYLFGLITMPFVGWFSGGFVGSIFTDIIPKSITSALGIMLFAMFIALVVPACKKSRPTTLVVIGTIIIDAVLSCIPAVKNGLMPSWIILICAITAATLGAIFFSEEKSQTNKDSKEGTN
jgi:predicted branched-subunit amino acid permease